MKTINLRDYRANPHAPLAIFVGVLVLLIVVQGMAAAPEAAPAPATPALIYVMTTRVPTVQPTADPEIAALKARIAALEAAQANEAPVYKVMAQPIVPTPELAPQEPAPTAWTADAVIVQRESGSTVEITVPESAPRYCRGAGFGDWRDYDAKYASSPVCNARP